MKPNLFIPGAPKSGTSSLHLYLDQHPEIQMSKIKETHNYAYDPHYVKRFDSDWIFSYNDIFHNDPKVKYFGESSTIHCITETTIPRIIQDEINPKIIFVLRDPIERILSHYNWLKSLGLVKKEFFKEIKDSINVPFDPNKNLNGNYKSYIEFSKYATFIKRWIDAFNRENVLIITTEELSSDYFNTINTCFDFLKLPQLDEIKIVRENVTTLNKQKISGKSISSLSKKILKSLFPNSLEQSGKPKSGGKHILAIEERKWLQNFLFSEVETLEIIIGRELTEWSNFKNNGNSTH
ncbi:MAG: hypothetical protein COW65_05145 [Cytophagales bacterium CG18_big_fil_WC_8_21_14_2_50_42_9]|nr:MAG: hypothetical protein COW65_05145 [Cytophagales bacterium CG18_big_fil_WC_8_21_14_2_50_42_9]